MKRSIKHAPLLACTAIVFAATTLVATAAAQAQELTLPELRQGYFVGFGVRGIANRSVDSDLGTFDPMTGFAFTLRGGQLVTPWLGLALRADYGMAQNKRWKEGFGGLMLEAQLPLWRGLAVHGGAGVGFAQALDSEEKVHGIKGTGGAYYTAGLSYDFFPLQSRGSGGWAVTPTVGVTYLPGETFRSAMLFVGIDGVFFRGLPKEELALPPDEAYGK